MMLNNGLKSVFVIHYDVIVKLAVGLLDIKYHHFII